MPRSSTTVHRTKKVAWSLKLPGPWTTRWSKQYLSAVNPVTCSLLWVRCLFDQISMSDFGGKWPLKWKFSKMSLRITFYGLRITPKYVLWPNLVKIGRCEVPERSRGLPNKKSSAGLVPAPILAKMGRWRPKFPERRNPLTCPRIPNLDQIGCVLPNLFRKDQFFSPKSQYNIGFQPTINKLH